MVVLAERGACVPPCRAVLVAILGMWSIALLAAPVASLVCNSSVVAAYG